MNYQNIRFFVVVGNTTREPTEGEARAIVTYLGSGQRYLGVWPVPAVGDVWFQRVPAPVE
jgi:hypothetical protein